MRTRPASVDAGEHDAGLPGRVAGPPVDYEGMMLAKAPEPRPDRLRIGRQDRDKPFILMGAIVAGLSLNRWLADGIPALHWVVEIGVFVVILAVMLPVKVADVARAFRKVKPTVLALAINFLFTPAFAWAVGWVFLRPHPDLWAGVILYTLTPCIGWYLIFIDLAEGDLPWGIALLPLNITLQVILLPAYLYLLVGRIVPVELAVLARSAVLFLILPFALSALLQRWVIARRGREFFLGPVKRRAGQVKLWALVLVIVAMFASQRALGMVDLSLVLLIIAVITLFFVALFALGAGVHRRAGTGHALSLCGGRGDRGPAEPGQHADPRHRPSHGHGRALRGALHGRD